MERDEFTFEADRYGYQILYKGQKVGGAGVCGRPQQHWRHARQNIHDNKAYALIAIRELLEGRGRPDMLSEIQHIARNTKNTNLISKG